MSQGGQLPWKRQTIDVSRGPIADYSQLRKALPAPPVGLEWHKCEETGEWKLKEQGLVSAFTGLNETEESKTSSDRRPRGEPDYLFHTVLPSDTMAGLCLRYKISATKLRQANKFSGSNLSLAPARLLIPLTDSSALNIKAIQLQDTNSEEYKMQVFLSAFPHLRRSERRAYLEINDWNLADATRNAADDDAWEQGKQLVAAKAEQAKQAHSLSRLHKNKTEIKHRPTATFAQVYPAEGLLEPLLKDELELAQRLS